MRKFSQIILGLLLFNFSLSAQYCDTDEPSPAAQKEYFLKLPKVKNTKHSSVDFILAPLSVHIIRDASGTGGITLEELNAALDRLNEQYIPAGIRFYTCGISYIDDDNLNQFEKDDDRAEAATYLVANTFNLFIVDNYTSGGSSSCGFAYYPSTGSWDMSVLSTSCVVQGTTLEHELGHALNLRHTHQGDGSELVARSGEGKPYNCDSDGDGFCDTAADPKLTGWTISGETCEVTNDDDLRDDNGDLFVPDGKNIMSYSPYKYCRSLFSKEQYAMMSYTIRNHADWTKMTCSSAFTADFDLSDLVAVAGQSVTLDNQSIGEGISYSWTIAGADITNSSDRDPVVVFESAGDFDVTLVISKASGFTAITKTIKVVVLKEIPFSEDFSAGISALDNYGIETKSESDFDVNSTAGQTDNGLYLEGSSSSDPPYYVRGQGGEKAFLSNPNFNSKLVIPGLDASKYSNLSLKFDAKQLYRYNRSYGSFRVLINNEPISLTYKIESDAEEVWNEYTFDLSTYGGTVFSLTFEANSKYDDTGVYFDNISISGIEDTLSFTADKVAGTTCEEIVFTAEGNASVSIYDWSFGDNAVPATGSGVGPHTVIYNVIGDKTVTLNGDQGNYVKTRTNYVSIDQGVNHEPTIAISITETLPICSGSSLEFTAAVENVGTGIVDWYIDDVKGPSGISFTLDNITSETSVVGKVTSNDDCSVNKSEIISNEIVVGVDVCTGITTVLEDKLVYPNPTSGKVFIKAKHVESILVSNILGEVVRLEIGKNEVNLSNYPRGVYVFSIKTAEGTFVKRIIKK